MITNIWRYAHLALAIVSFLFIAMASITGAILSFEPILDKSKSYKVENFDEITLTESVKNLKEKYPELMKLSVDNHQFVTIEGFDEEGNELKKIVNPRTGEIMGEPLVQNSVMQWVTTLHRSLFLHETGRFIVGIFSFLLLLITITGSILLIKRQKGLRNFFSKINRDSWAQYLHTAGGRLLLIPIFIVTFTATYLFLLRFEIIKSEEVPTLEAVEISEGESRLNIEDYPAFKGLYLSDIKEIEFPFDDSPEEFYKVKTKRSEFLIDQVKGQKVQEIEYPMVKVFETISLDLHTGRTNGIWAFILGLASLNILMFIYTGFAITFRRLSHKKIRNKIDSNEAKIVLLVGSENGTTWGFAQEIFNQLSSAGRKVYIAQMNDYKEFKSMERLIILTSTYGLGDAPLNARFFKKLLKKYPQKNKVDFSVIGFGSKSYTDFCGFAVKVSDWLSQQDWAVPLVPPFFVNERSMKDFSQWIKAYNNACAETLVETPAFCQFDKPNLMKMSVLERSEASSEDEIFTLKINTKEKFQSGDLLAIYPKNDHRERLYSIGKVDGALHLVVKLHNHGLGSQFLYQLEDNQVIRGKIISNKSFHKPKNKDVIFISNGTGIAPFLGMIAENEGKNRQYLYAGFKRKTKIISQFEKLVNHQQNLGNIEKYSFTFSRENDRSYVTDLIRNDEEFVFSFLKNGGVIMVCGSIAMWKDVEAILKHICEKNQQSLDLYRENILIDCY